MVPRFFCGSGNGAIMAGLGVNRVEVTGAIDEVKVLETKAGKPFGSAVMLAAPGSTFEFFVRDVAINKVLGAGMEVKLVGKLTRSGFRTGVDLVQALDSAGKQLYPVAASK